MSAFDLDAYILERQAAVNAAIDARLPAPPAGDDPGRLREAMRYGALLGGKRMRPILTIAACESVGGSIEAALPAACALEMIHAYSLVHDDLPAMDNDLERRGQPTVHVEFGHANAILTGDALLTDAFRVLVSAEGGIPRGHVAEAVAMLSPFIFSSSRRSRSVRRAASTISPVKLRPRKARRVDGTRGTRRAGRVSSSSGRRQRRASRLSR